MQSINDQDWETLGNKFRKADPFPSICIDNFLDHEFALELSRSYPSFDNAQDLGRVFNAVNERKKVQITDPKRFPKPVDRLQKELSSQVFINAMQTLSGIENLKFDPDFSGGGMHITGAGGILDVHVDFNYSDKLNLYRRLNLLLYLNEEWAENWGGNVELWDESVKRCAQSFAPIFNRCVIFATSDSSFHGVTAVTAPENHPRKSFAIYLYNEAPSSTKYGSSHSTIFRARPSEKLKRFLLMPAENSWRGLRIGFDKSKQAIKRIARL